ncbi:MAG: IS200/IS605 family transposase [Chloroflexota bacterium]|nr:IS200/IS605 family transposase [Chloroflexota bacterium]
MEEQPITYFAPDRALYTEKRHAVTCVHKLDFHLVISTKYRRPVLVGDVGQLVRDLIVQKAAELETWLLGVAVQPEHVHILIGLKPTQSVAEIVGQTKGVTSFQAFKQFPDLLEAIGEPKLWSGGYFASSVGKTNVAQNIAYLQRQHEHHALPDD